MKRAGIVTAFMIILLAVAFTSSIVLQYARAANGVEITLIIPTTHIGKVGDTVLLVGTLNTTDGEYRIWFGTHNVTPTEPMATENQVNATFQIPQVPNENYTITLQDVDKNINATTWFYVETAYHVEGITPSTPQQLQENSTIEISMNVTGGKADSVYYANVSVVILSPLNTTYSAMVELTNTTNTGFGYAKITYPNQTLFQPSGSNTNYTGLYRIYFNETQSLAEDSFFVGVTDKSEYHREEFVEIKAAGYQPNQTANITVTFPNVNKTDLWSVNASQQGIINATWNVPSNASIGVYNITINSEAPTKLIQDSQLFSIPGYPIEIHTRNLGEGTVPQVLVEAFDQATNITNDKTSDENGVAHFQLEKGNHTLDAFWKGKVKVGEMQNVTIAGNNTYNLVCELTNMKIAVKDNDENLIPFVSLNINYSYITTKESKEENVTMAGQTDIFGLFLINSTLTHINYTIKASRYGIVFNQNNNTLQDLPARAWFNVTVLCPPKTLTLNITENHRNPLPNARVELIEQMGGIAYTETTDSTGMVTRNCTFGNYTVKVYTNNILLKETSVELFNNTYQEIYCQLYNLTLSVKVIDYFGQPISNVNVTWQLGDLQNSALTKSDGLATFSDVIGGDLQVSVYLPEQSQPFMVTASFVNSSGTIEIKLDEYVILAGFLVETSYLITAIIIAVTVILVLSIEVYRRKRSKPQKGSD